jgi:arylsulfatase B
MVYALDRGVGKLVNKLKEKGVFENTLIVFLSDNGGKTIASANNFPRRDGKGSTCEGGYRVSMFFHWPKHVPAGQISDFPISAMDLYPIFAYLAKAKIPEGKQLDGKNIWDDFSNGQNPYKDQNIYALRH